MRRAPIVVLNGPRRHIFLARDELQQACSQPQRVRRSSITGLRLPYRPALRGSDRTNALQQSSIIHNVALGTPEQAAISAIFLV